MKTDFDVGAIDSLAQQLENVGREAAKVLLLAGVESPADVADCRPAELAKLPMFTEESARETISSAQHSFGVPTADSEYDTVAVIASDECPKSQFDSLFDVVDTINNAPMSPETIVTVDEWQSHGIAVQIDEADADDFHGDCEPMIGGRIETPWNELETARERDELGTSTGADGSVHYYWEQAPAVRNQLLVERCDAVIVLDTGGYVGGAIQQLLDAGQDVYVAPSGQFYRPTSVETTLYELEDTRLCIEA